MHSSTEEMDIERKILNQISTLVTTTPQFLLSQITLHPIHESSLISEIFWKDADILLDINYHYFANES